LPVSKLSPYFLNPHFVGFHFYEKHDLFLSELLFFEEGDQSEYVLRGERGEETSRAGADWNNLY